MNHSCCPNAKSFKREEVVLEADGYQPYLISTEKGFRSLIKIVIELAKDPPRLMFMRCVYLNVF
ncbi:hypothetical protein ARALYDRAFT_914498 [Arabidopsis lyrata subsp. lyrata]|uniref:Uncharacterized protein n=1 Tax=Arabidopsis lyrata subsp. lyrata TaxID=81972 RepID=D7MEQ8_ARALL|nr:hypothetical protein ARALYDRAFT_914498 [Arabidopsis lyrata subsp. lyrata]